MRQRGCAEAAEAAAEAAEAAAELAAKMSEAAAGDGGDTDEDEGKDKEEDMKEDKKKKKKKEQEGEEEGGMSMDLDSADLAEPVFLPTLQPMADRSTVYPNPNPNPSIVSIPDTGPMHVRELGGEGHSRPGLRVLRGRRHTAPLLRCVWQRGAYHVHIVILITTYHNVSQCIMSYHNIPRRIV